MQTETNSEPLPAEITGNLDRGLQRLSRKERDAVLLRFFEERPLQEVGASLGITEDAAKKRVTRALEKLRKFLGGRGTQLSSVALVAALTQGTAKAAVSAAAISKVTASALAPAATSALLADVLAAWRWAKIKLLVGAGSGVVVTALIVSHTISRMDGKNGDQSRGVASAQVANNTNKSSLTLSDSSSEEPPRIIQFDGQTVPAHPLKIIVLDATTGEPIAGVAVGESPAVSTDPEGHPKTLFTNPKGVVAMAVPDPFPGDERVDQFDVYLHAKDYASRDIEWFSSTGAVFSIVTNSYTVRLESGTTLSGSVANEKGQALQGVRVGMLGSDHPINNWTLDENGKEMGPPTLRATDFPEYFQGSEQDDAVVTDDSGRFHFEHVPSDLKAIMVDLIGSDGERKRFETPLANRIFTPEDQEKISLGELQKGTARLIMRPGITFQGVVVDEAGNPVPGATVTESAQWGSPIILSHADTDYAGRFWMSNRPAREVILSATADGRASASTIVDLKTGMGTPSLQLPPALPLKGRVINQDGQPVSGANIDVSGLYNEGLGLIWDGKTDAQGSFEWRGAPTNEIALSISARDYPSRVVHLQATTNELLVTLNANRNNNAAYVTGTVADAASGKPVENFTVKVRHDRWSDWERGLITEGSHGGFSLSTSQSEVQVGTQPSWFLSIQAEGYEPYETRIYYYEEGDQAFDIKLQPGGSIEGLVRNPKGGPESGCQVNVATLSDKLLSSHAGEFSLYRNWHPPVQTDAAGHFKLEKPFGATAVVAFDNSGWAIANIRTNSPGMELKLLPWGQIQGTLMHGDTPLVDQNVRLGDLVPDRSNPIQILRNTRTDSDGHFAFDKVPAGEYQISLNSRSWPYVETMQTSVDVSVGKTNHISLTESGRTVLAKLIASQSTTVTNWDNCSAILKRNVFLPAAPLQFSFVTTESYLAAESNYSHDPAVLAARRNMRTYRGHTSSDGSIIFENVPPGDYLFDVRLPAKSSGYGPTDMIDVLNISITVPADETQSTNVVNLGAFSLDGV